MCFSAEASFSAGAALLPLGVFCTWKAAQVRPRLVPLALLPVLFGIQQISEGFVWLGLQRGDPGLIQPASLIYLFFALAFWPFWFPFLTACSETEHRKRRIFFGIAAVAVAWFWILYYPIARQPSEVLSIRVVHHSLQYDYANLAIYQVVPRPLLRVLYFLCVAVPMAFGSESLGKLPGIVFAASAVLSAVLFEHAFISVWCFFAALLSAYLVWIFSRLKVADSPTPANC